jgi:hypothetical protein
LCLDENLALGLAAKDARRQRPLRYSLVHEGRGEIDHPGASGVRTRVDLLSGGRHEACLHAVRRDPRLLLEHERGDACDHRSRHAGAGELEVVEPERARGPPAPIRVVPVTRLITHCPTTMIRRLGTYARPTGNPTMQNGNEEPPLLRLN